MCGARYGSDAAVALTERWMARIRDGAYMASVGLAREKGAFPLFDRARYLAGEIAGKSPDATRFGKRLVCICHYTAKWFQMCLKVLCDSGSYEKWTALFRVND